MLICSWTDMAVIVLYSNTVSESVEAGEAGMSLDAG